MAKIWLISNKKTAWWFVLAVFLFILDRFLKNLALAGADYDILGRVLRFSFAANHGIAFSIPLGGFFLNSLIGLILVFLAVFMVKSWQEAKFLEAGALMLVFLGALSNLYDRFSLGFVVDYWDLAYFSVFNLADVLIFYGLAWYSWLKLKEKAKR
jgi:signal peptidase II